MRVWLPYFVVVLLVLLPMSLSAQSRGFLSREALDSLVNPKNSTKALGVLTLSHSTIALGEIEGDDTVYFNFELRNTSHRSVEITEFRPSCSCTKVATKPQSIAPNATLRVSASFNPAGRSSGFNYRINIYTDLDSELPTDRVVVEGSVRSNDKWQHLPQRSGVLRLSRKEVTIVSHGEERIAVANGGDRAITITARPTVEGLSLRCEPKTLMPDTEGNIFIGFRGEVASELNTIVILQGVEASPAESMIKVTIKR